MPRQSSEMFYEEGGRRQDADLHDPILNGLPPEAERAQMMDARDAAARAGASQEQLDRLLPLDD